MKTVTLAATPHQVRQADADNNPLLKQLMNATPAQVATYMTTHVTSLAEAQKVLTALALALRYLYLRTGSGS